MEQKYYKSQNNRALRSNPNENEYSQNFLNCLNSNLSQNNRALRSNPNKKIQGTLDGLFPVTK